MNRRLSKAEHYIQLLDDARCENNWDAVPEYVRKVLKHAPERTCLTLVAEIERSIAKATQNVPPAIRQSSPLSAQDLDASSQLPKLLAAIEQEHGLLEDRFQAQVCLGWLHWVVGEYNLATVRLPGTIDQEYSQFESLGRVSDWTKVCALKSAYLKANSLARSDRRAEALEAFKLSLPSLSSIWTTRPTKNQLRYWSELYLTEFCLLQGQLLQEDPNSLRDPNCLACFRCWEKYWDSPGASVAGGYGFKGTVPRRRIWLAYYDIISRILKQDLPFPTGYAAVLDGASARRQLFTELKQVEAKYEALLLSETQFPRAEDEREEVEAFVELVMANWTILNGRGWREHDLGQNGKESLSRGVLDILYRAATKTYHSTAILRNLFRVHIAVAEFDLAFKSLDSYLDLVNRGKARVEKTGHPEPSLDDDATVMVTISAAIVALCRYGDNAAAEKARGLASELERWVEDVKLPPQSQERGLSPVEESDGASSLGGRPGAGILALSWQAIGLAQAQWARVTIDAASRVEIQKKAVLCLRRSLSSEFGQSADVRGIFALGVLLAEQRELSSAIELVKSALLAEKMDGIDQELNNGAYWRERSLIPLWHLLSLLLSARQDYMMASRACEGAFEQFKDPSVLFGTKRLNGMYRSDHLNEMEAVHEKYDEDGSGVVDDMDDYERETVLEVKMTQLALIEIVEGPKVAVNASLELLSLFSRLFGVPQPEVKRAPPKTADVPKSSTGTLRSLKGSIFGSRSERQSQTRHSMASSERVPVAQSRPQTMQTAEHHPGLTAQSTNESGYSVDNQRRRKSASMTRRSESGRRASLRKRESSASRRRAVSSGPVSHPPTSHPPTVVDGESYFTPYGETVSPSNDFFNGFASKRFGVRSRTGSHTSDGTGRPGTTDLDGLAVDKLEAHPALLPVIQFSQEYDKRRRNAVLIKVWLMIAGFYRRATMLEDAQGALAEATKLVQSIEADAGKDATTSLSSGQDRWALEKSVEQLWGDIWAERGYLSIAAAAPYVARADFETALMHYPDHPSAIVGLSNILLDIYSEDLLPPPAVPGVDVSTAPSNSSISSTGDLAIRNKQPAKTPEFPPSAPLGLAPSKPSDGSVKQDDGKSANPHNDTQLPPPHRATSLPLVDRLSARDRAYGLLSGLTKSGPGWNYSEAWFALARAHEESGQPDKAKEALWWCVELEEGRGVREWDCIGPGGYVL